jgi:BioD-like phosphotransacetylase family protein
MPEPKRIFVAATRQNEGKTTTCLGLLLNLRREVRSLGFIKPVGQRYMEVDGERIDEDAVLMDEIFHLHPVLKETSPIAIGKTFTRDYDRERDRPALVDKILKSFKAVAAGKDIVVIEGTGHAGVGSCFDLNNAHSARLLEAPVVIVTSGGMGRPIDEILLNLPVFEKQGVKVLGAILNKVLPDKLDEVKDYVGRTLANHGITLFGVMPLMKMLSGPSMQQIREGLKCEVLNGAENLGVTIGEVIVGAVEAHRMLDDLGPNTLLVTPGGREDLILAAMSSGAAETQEPCSVAGIVLTEGVHPHKTIMQLIRRTRMPVLVVKSGIYETTSTIHDLLVKIRPNDRQKIALVGQIVEQNVDLSAMMKSM